MRLRRVSIAALMVCLISLATLAFAGGSAPQEPTAAPNPPNEAEPGNTGRSGNIQNRLEALSKQLNLTDQQKGKIRPLMRHEVKRIKIVQSNTNLSQAQVRRRIAMIRRTTNQHIAKLLTPEQKQQ